MKKLIYIILFSITVSATNAQIKIIKKSLIGKWQISAISVEDFMYYNVAKDSLKLLLNESTAQSMGVGSLDSSELSTAIKANLTTSFTKEGIAIYIVFNADETIIGGFGLKDAQIDRYILDEDNNTLTFKNKNIITNSESDEKFKIYIKNNMLVLENLTHGKKTTMEFKKV